MATGKRSTISDTIKGSLAPRSAHRTRFKSEFVNGFKRETARASFLLMMLASCSPRGYRAEELALLLQSPVAAEREEASRRLIEMGETALPALKSGLGTAGPEERSRIQDVLNGVELAALRGIRLDPIGSFVVEGGIP